MSGLGQPREKITCCESVLLTSVMNSRAAVRRHSVSVGDLWTQVSLHARQADQEEL